MVKNAIDVVFGGLTYWMFGYAFAFGEEPPYATPFNGWGYFFVHANEEDLGWVYSKFFFQASFATTATTIVSGAMAERTRLEAYIVFSLVNTLIFCFPAHWMWGANGWLRTLGAVDIAGAGPVHLVGGVTGLVATIVLKPRHGRYDSDTAPQMGSPTNAILGMFMLWWGWLGFNCGSTFGISGMKWKLAARSAVATLCASIGGGVMGIVASYIAKRKRIDVAYLINSVLGSLVGITALCALAEPWEGLVIGAIGALVTCISVAVLDKLKVDDPVGCVGTHAFGGAWSLLAVGLFAQKDVLSTALEINTDHAGLFRGGGWYLLGIQTLSVVSISTWSMIMSYIFLKLIQVTIGLRVPLHVEILGADLVEHGITASSHRCRHTNVIPDRMTSKDNFSMPSSVRRRIRTPLEQQFLSRELRVQSQNGDNNNELPKDNLSLPDFENEVSRTVDLAHDVETGVNGAEEDDDRTKPKYSFLNYIFCRFRKVQNSAETHSSESGGFQRHSLDRNGYSYNTNVLPSRGTSPQHLPLRDRSGYFLSDCSLESTYHHSYPITESNHHVRTVSEVTMDTLSEQPLPYSTMTYV